MMLRPWPSATRLNALALGHGFVLNDEVYLVRRMSCFYLSILLTLCVGLFLTKALFAATSPCGDVPVGELPREKDLNKLKPEDLLSSYLKINTSNPPGCEGKAARFWKQFFDRYGIESEVIPLPFGDDRANIIARVKGRSTGLRPIVLLNHMDVVPADPSRWSVSPFSGEIRRGIIYGRGTFDMKATGTYQALMLARAKVQNWPMNRDLIFLGTANEEGPFDPEHGVISGAEWMLKNRMDALERPEFVVTEGGYIPTSGGKPLRWEVSPGEKARLEVTFTVNDPKGSESEKLMMMARAAFKVMTEFRGKRDQMSDARWRRILLDPVERANHSTTHALTIFGGVGKGNTIPATAVAEVRLSGQSVAASKLERQIRKLLPKAVKIELSKSVDGDFVLHLKSSGEAGHASLPPLDGGANLLLANAIVGLDRAINEKKIPVNEISLKNLAAISDEQTAERPEFAVDFRLLPGESRDGVLHQLRQFMAGFPVTLKITDDAVMSDASPIDTPLFRSIVDANKKFYPNPANRPVVKTPILNSTTDAAYFRQHGMIVYGFEPIMLDPKDEHSHGDDEQISVKAMRFATDVTEFYLKQFLSSPH